MAAREQTGTEDGTRANCCPLYHEAVELVGRRWTGAILRVLMDGPLRFSEIAASIPELSDRLLSERMKELEARGMVRAHGDLRAAAAGPLRALGDGPRARAGAGRAPDLGAALAGRPARLALTAASRRPSPASPAQPRARCAAEPSRQLTVRPDEPQRAAPRCSRRSRAPAPWPPAPGHGPRSECDGWRSSCALAIQATVPLESETRAVDRSQATRGQDSSIAGVAEQLWPSDRRMTAIGGRAGVHAATSERDRDQSARHGDRVRSCWPAGSSRSRRGSRDGDADPLSAAVDRSPSGRRPGRRLPRASVRALAGPQPGAGCARRVEEAVPDEEADDDPHAASAPR